MALASALEQLLTRLGVNAVALAEPNERIARVVVVDARIWTEILRAAANGEPMRGIAWTTFEEHDVEDWTQGN